MDARRPVVLVGLLAVLLVGGGLPSTAPVAAAVPSSDTAPTVNGSATPISAAVVAVSPNPTRRDDVGEWILVEFSGATTGAGWSVADGESVADLPNRTLRGRVVLTTAPRAVRDALADGRGPTLANATVVGVAGRLALSNAGERVELRRGGRVVDAVAYGRAPEGRRYVLSDTGWEWRRPGATDLPPVVDGDRRATLFVLPDTPGIPLAAVEAARERVWIGAYTFASRRLGGALCAANRRGVDVRVLVERAPVGGLTHRSVATLDRLVDCGVAVQAIGGPGGRYAVHHPKYAVVDDRAIVLSENWKPAGTGGRSSRGWGTVVDSPRLARALARLFESDAGFRDVAPWRQVRPAIEPVREPVANGSYPPAIPPRSVEVDRARLLVAPDNAEGELLALLARADRSIEVQQVAVGGPEAPLLNATIRAAERGVSVRILLSSAWYVRDENRRLVQRLDRLARRDGLPLRARLVRPRSRFEKSHVKGIVVDGESVVLGSLNWNHHARRENREVLLVLEDRAAAAYYRAAFTADWRGGRWRLPGSLGVGTVLAGVVAATVRAGRVRFAQSTS